MEVDGVCVCVCTTRLLPGFIMSYSTQESRPQTITLDAYFHSSVNH